MVNLDFLGYPNYYVTESGDVYSNHKKDFLIPQRNSQDYFHVSLSNEGKSKTFTVHRLVGLCYNGDSFKEGYHCHHKDGNIHNNHYTNLSWLSPADHIKEGWRLGQYTCKYTRDVCNRINTKLKEGFSDEMVADHLDIPIYIVAEFRTGKADTYSTGKVEDRYLRKDRSKISEDVALEIVDLLNKGWEDYKIASALDIPRKSVNRLRRGETFSHLQKLITKTPASSEKSNRRLGYEDIKNILLMKMEGKGPTEISKELSLGIGSVTNVLLKRCYVSIINTIADELACKASASLKEIEESKIEC